MITSADAVPQSEQYKKGFEDAKRAFLVEYARESKNMRKRNAQLEVMLNAYRAISTDAVHGEWKPFDLTWGRNIYFCTACKESIEVPTVNGRPSYNYCPNCGAMMTPYKGGDVE